MKKITGLFLVLLLCLSSVAAFASVPFSYSGSDIEILRTWSEKVKSEGKDWYLTWEEHNLANDHRAVVRIHAGYNAASPLFVYSYPSSNPHTYKSGYGYGKKRVEVRGRLDNRDAAQGELVVSGTFHE